jgi:hypothetical protein
VRYKCQQNPLFHTLSKIFIIENSDKVNFKVVSVHAMKPYKVSVGIAALIVNLGTRWTSLVIFTPRSLYARKERSVSSETKTQMEDTGRYKNKHTVFWSITRFWTFPVMWPTILWHIKLPALYYKHAHMSFNVCLF